MKLPDRIIMKSMLWICAVYSILGIILTIHDILAGNHRLVDYGCTWTSGLVAGAGVVGFLVWKKVHHD